MKKIVIGILAHVDSGKTTLSEAMLYTSGSIGKLGRVDHRDSFLDTFRLERERGITIFSKQAVFERGDVSFTLLDTPGHVDFSSEAERTLQVLDYAVLVISAVDGVQSHTVTLWRLLMKYRVPCFIFINKMDQAGADAKAALEDIKTKLSASCVDFSNTASDAFYEAAALCDEKLLDEYYASGAVGDEGVARAVSERAIFPCFFGSALKLNGVDRLLDGICRYTLEAPRREGFAARVFKIAQYDRSDRLTFIKVTGGSLKVRDAIAAPDGSEEKISQIRVYSGDKFTALDRADQGTVCAVTGLSFTRPGDGLGAESGTRRPLLEPVLTYRVEILDGTDPNTVLSRFKILESEDPQLNVEWSERLREIRVRLMGEIQLEVLRTVVEQRFGIRVGFGVGNIIYKETITDTVEGVGHFEPLRHYAEVHLLLRPGKRGSGLVFRSDCREDQLDRNWQRLVLTHLAEKQHVGVLCGAPITDMEITLVAGKAHVKHTEGGDFRQATYRALRQGLRCAHSILLEPVYDFTLTVPADCLGRATSDISRMSGSIDPPQNDGTSATLTGSAPVSEIADYAREVAKYTLGTGSLSLSPKGYEPCHNEEKIVAAAGYDCDADLENPCDSVFCSHGAGHVVKWNEVKDHMHIPFVHGAENAAAPAAQNKEKLKKLRDEKDIFALDRELMSIFERTYGPVKRRAPDADVDPFRERERAAEKARRPVKSKLDGTEYLLVDGYNVIFSWPHLKELAEENVDAARAKLTNVLCNYRGYKKCEVILVFDAYKVKGSLREVENVDGISIVYTKEAETADTYIEKAAYDLSKKHFVRVVTSDALAQLIIFGSGALRVSSREFLDEVRAVEEEIREIIATAL